MIMVSQGGVLSPLIFNIFVYDIPKSEDVLLAQFAVDIDKNSESITKAARKLSRYLVLENSSE